MSSADLSRWTKFAEEVAPRAIKYFYGDWRETQLQFGEQYDPARCRAKFE